MTQIEDVRREAKALSKLSHPHLVGFYGICIDPPFLCVVTELMDGSLRDAIYNKRSGLQWQVGSIVRRAGCSGR
jgi:serine/threonine protein kinase